jgi:hypothetical protein
MPVDATLHVYFGFAKHSNILPKNTESHESFMLQRYRTVILMPAKLNCISKLVKNFKSRIQISIPADDSRPWHVRLNVEIRCACYNWFSIKIISAALIEQRRAYIDAQLCEDYRPMNDSVWATDQKSLNWTTKVPFTGVSPSVVTWRPTHLHIVTTLHCHAV